MIHPKRNKLPAGGNRFSGWLGDTLLKVTGWQIKGELPNEQKLVIAIAPHTSNWDFFLGVAVLFSLRIRIRFLGKHTIFVPGVKQLLESIGGIPVKRSSSHGVVSQIVDKFKQQESMILALSPEGTRSPILPWKTGFLSIAHQANVPVLLIGFDFAKKHVIIGPLIHTQGDTEADMLKIYDFFRPIQAKYPQDVRYPDA